MRIVSLLPSATEIVCCLGLQEQLVGVSHECDYPPGVEQLPKVTKTLIPPDLPSGEIDAHVRAQLSKESALYSLRLDTLEELKPDLIVTQALCEVCAVAETEVQQAVSMLSGNPEVVNLEPMSLEDVFSTIRILGERTGNSNNANRVIAEYKQRVAVVVNRTGELNNKEYPKVGFLEWIDPLFNAGHWTPELISMAGGRDCFGSLNKPSYTMPSSALTGANPDILVIALCGFTEERTVQDLPLLQKIEGWNELNCVKSGELYYTDGNAYFSRPGPRLVDSLELLAHILHAELHPLPSHLNPAMKFAL